MPIISPDWYGVDNQVPTWNYVAVHIRGALEQLDHGKLHPILERLSTNMEDRLTPKTPWKIDKMDPDVYVKMQRQIVLVAMKVDDIQGTWKLSQNKPLDAREGAMTGIKDARIGTGLDELANQMRMVRDD